MTPSCAPYIVCASWITPLPHQNHNKPLVVFVPSASVIEYVKYGCMVYVSYPRTLSVVGDGAKASQEAGKGSCPINTRACIAITQQRSNLSSVNQSKDRGLANKCTINMRIYIIIIMPYLKALKTL